MLLPKTGTRKTYTTGIIAKEQLLAILSKAWYKTKEPRRRLKLIAFFLGSFSRKETFACFLDILKKKHCQYSIRTQEKAAEDTVEGLWPVQKMKQNELSWK